MNHTITQQRVKDLKSFYTNCIWFGIVAVIILGRNFIKWMTTDYTSPAAQSLPTLSG